MPDADRKRTRRAWLLPPALALVAIAVQFGIDTPHGEMIYREPAATQPPKQTSAARTPRKYRARGEAYIKRLRKSWSAKPIEDEPKDRRFADHHEALLRSVARKAEVAAAPADEAVLASTRIDCRTIRCDFELCAPPQLADEVVAQLRKFQVGKQALWHSINEVATDQSNATRACHRFIVDFAVEGADPRRLRIPDEG